MSVVVKTSGGGKYRKGKTVTSENLRRKSAALTFLSGYTSFNDTHAGDSRYFAPMMYCEKLSNGEIISFAAYLSDNKIYIHKYRHTDMSTTLETSVEIGASVMNTNYKIYITSQKNSNYICVSTSYSGCNAYVLNKSDLSIVDTVPHSVTSYVSMYDDKLYINRYGDANLSNAFQVYSIANKNYEVTKKASEIGGFLFANSAPIVKDGYIYMTCEGTTSTASSTALVCLNPDYTVRWKKTYEDLGSTSKLCRSIACVLSNGKFIVVGTNELRLHDCADGSIISSNANKTALGSGSHTAIPSVVYDSERLMILRQSGKNYGDYIDLIDTTSLEVISQLKLNYTSHFEGYAEGDLILGIADSSTNLKIGKAYPSDIYEILD